MSHIPEAFVYLHRPEDAVRQSDLTNGFSTIEPLLIGDATNFPYARSLSEELYSWICEDTQMEDIREAIRSGLRTGRALNEMEQGMVSEADVSFRRVQSRFKKKNVGNLVTIPHISVPGEVLSKHGETLEFPILSYHSLQLRKEPSMILERIARGAWSAASYIHAHSIWMKETYGQEAGGEDRSPK